MVPFITHRDPIIKLGRTIEKIQDNMVSFLYDYYAFPDNHNEDIMKIPYKIRDYKYSSIEELIRDCEKICNGYTIQKNNI